MKLPRWFASTLNRIVLAHGLALVLAFASVAAVSVAGFDRLLERDSRDAVRAERDALMDVYAADGRDGLRRAITELVRSPDDREAVYLLVEADGGVSAGHSVDLPVRLGPRAGWLRLPWREDINDEVLAYVQPLPAGGWLVTGHATREQQRVRELVTPLGIASLTALAALSLLLGWLLRRAVDRALKAPLDTVDRVGAGRLDERVPVAEGEGEGDAFDRLGRTLNHMLDRIHALVGGIQSSTDAIAHDLRTPLTRLRTRLEQARLETTDPAARAAIDAAAGEADQLLATFNGLLRLARIEAGAFDASPVALDEVLGDAVEMWQALTEANGQRLEADLAPATVAGDRDLLFQLATNLLDNAAKYGGRGCTIGVRLRSDARGVDLSVEDNGPGLAPPLAARAFDRFVRGEAHRGTPGTGLGLSVVRAIAIHHGAQLWLEPRAPGLRVHLHFPPAPQPPATGAPPMGAAADTWTNGHATESPPAGPLAQPQLAGTPPAPH
jgi:signal transduction histidine kinase